MSIEGTERYIVQEQDLEGNYRLCPYDDCGWWCGLGEVSLSDWYACPNCRRVFFVKAWEEGSEVPDSIPFAISLGPSVSTPEGNPVKAEAWGKGYRS